VTDKDANSYISTSTAVPSSESCPDSSSDDCSSTASTSCYNSCSSNVDEEIDDLSGEISSSGGGTVGNSSSSGIKEIRIEHGQPVIGLWDSYWMKPSVSPSQLASSDDNRFDHIINVRLLSFDRVRPLLVE